MQLSDQMFDALLILMWLGTPLVFAVSLFYQAENRSGTLSLPKLRLLPSFALKEGVSANGVRRNSPILQSQFGASGALHKKGV